MALDSQTITLNNAGTFLKSAGAGESDIGANFNILSSMVDVQAGTLSFGAADTSISQLQGNMLTGGSLQIETSATLDITPGATITTNQGNVTLSGQNSVFTPIDSLAANEGSFALPGLLEQLEPRVLLSTDLYVTGVLPTGGAGTPFDRMEITFSQAVQDGSFTKEADIQLTGPGGAITPTALNKIAADRYELVSTGLTGLNAYTLILGPTIANTSGILMNQDHDATPGEAGQDAYTARLAANGLTINSGDTTYDGGNLVLYGNTATIDGTHSFGSVEVLGGATLTHSAATTTTQSKLDLTITDTLLVGAGSKIDVTGKGYLPGRTTGNTTDGGATGYSGGSYGGLGFDSGGGVTNKVYGDYHNPNQLGSGSGPSFGSAGGGLVRITASTATIDGSILANGANAPFTWYGAGSGGGVFLDVGTLSGGGTISANGGDGYYYGSGGGGRVAVYYDTLKGLDTATKITAHGGSNGANGSVGTIYLKPDESEGTLLIDAHTSAPGTWTPLGILADTSFTAEQLIISGTGVVAATEHQMPIQAHHLTIRNGAVLTTLPTTTTQEYSLAMTVTGDLLIDSASKIDVSGKGYLPGRTTGNTTDGGATGYSGGSYGGLGFDSSGGVTHKVYGDYHNPNELGSGSGPSFGSAGGGLVRITASTATIDGSILANGANAPFTWYGAGSGGGIRLDVGTLAGGGLISANGGDGYYYGSGGGGRIAVYYDTLNGFDATTKIAAHGGGAGSGHGAVGTVYLKPEDGEGTLLIDAHGSSPASWTPLGIPGDAGFTAEQLILSGAGVIVAPEHQMPIQAHHLTIRNGTVLTTLPTTTIQEYLLAMTVTGDLLIDSASKIEVSGKGYLPGRTLGNTTTGGATGAAGGSYGGLGFDSGGGAANKVYGDYHNPNELGSGSGPSFGSAGGGLVRITASTATIDGSILANGANAPFTWYGAGSGGGVFLDVGTLSGGGTISANGGGGYYYGSGGGGRVAVYYDTLNGFDTANKITVHGGGTGSGWGGTGTIYLKQDAQDGELHIDSHGQRAGSWTPLGLPGDDSFKTENVIVSGAGVVVKPEHPMPIQTMNFSLLNGALATHQAASAALPGPSLLLWVSGELLIDADSKIDVSGLGYPAGVTLGYQSRGAASGSSGGSYGGLGFDRDGVANPVYGDYRNPNELGSGAGPSWGAAGGGLVRITAETATINGSILANGANAPFTWYGGGSGGGILLNVGTLTGAGVLSANGGAGYYGGSGGGGRIAVYDWTAMDLPEANITVRGGAAGSGAGQAGSIYITSTDRYLAWSNMANGLFHNIEPLSWTTLGVNPSATTVQITATSSAGIVTILGTGLAANGVLDWNTPTVPDGVYELRSVTRDAAGNVLVEGIVEVTVNNTIGWHSGDVSSDETWANNRVHVVDGDVTIATGARLTVLEGTVVKFAPGTGITISDGAFLDALGGADAPIVFTSWHDDTAGGDINMDGDNTLPRPGDWSGLGVLGTGLLNLNENTELHYITTTHSGTLSSDQVWMGTFLHRVTGTLVVPSSVTLTINPGAIVKFDSGIGITVQSGGTLNAFGSIAQPIVFTSVKDDRYGGDTNLDGDRTSPFAGDWRSILLESGGTGTFGYAEIQYGGNSIVNQYGAGGMIENVGGTLTFDNGLIGESLKDGVLGGGTTTIRNSLVLNNDRGVVAWGSPATILNSTLDGNRVGVLAHGGTPTVRNSIITNSLQYGVDWDWGGSAPY